MGSGVFVSSGDVTFNSCQIYDNRAGAGGVSMGGGGGGVYVSYGTVTFHSCDIRNNNAVLFGGGVSIQGGDVTFNSCKIRDNTALSVRASFRMRCPRPIAHSLELPY